MLTFMEPVLNTSRAIEIQEKTQTGESRRASVEMGSKLGFDERLLNNLAIIVTEAATNILKHGSGGELVLRPLFDTDDAGVEILALDNGPGMHNVGRCQQDGYSTSSTPGTGLGAISRLATFSEVYSLPELGTVLLAQIWRSNGHRRTNRPVFVSGAVSTAMRGESACGDAWHVLSSEQGERVFMADGLGHGPEAAHAANEAVRVFIANSGIPLLELLARIHHALRPTRGAAIAVAEIDSASRVIRYGGVGNISASVLTENAPRRQMVSMNGTAGHQLRTAKQFEYPWDAEATLVMHSDGVASHWSIDRYPGLLRRHPSIAAGILYRDHKRGRDDTSILVMRGVPQAA